MKGTKIKTILFLSLLAMITFTTISCSKDDSESVVDVREQAVGRYV